MWLSQSTGKGLKVALRTPMAFSSNPLTDMEVASRTLSRPPEKTGNRDGQTGARTLTLGWSRSRGNDAFQGGMDEKNPNRIRDGILSIGGKSEYESAAGIRSENTHSGCCAGSSSGSCSFAPRTGFGAQTLNHHRWSVRELGHQFELTTHALHIVP